FYRVYHSMRYVGGQLVLRLQHALPEPLLDFIRGEFADIVTSGTFEQGPALAAEANDPHLIDMPRLRFHFDRRSLGRLRPLIDLINREGSTSEDRRWVFRLRHSAHGMLCRRHIPQASLPLAA